MRIAFVDHVFHRRTRSSAFMIDILSSVGEVDVMSVDPDRPGDRSEDAVVRAFLTAPHDLWVFWQTDNTAARLVPLGLRGAVIVPMYDASWGHPDRFFNQFVNQRFLCFSWAMHERLQRLHLRSALFEYWPEPEAAPERSYERADWSAYFWERKPFDRPNARQVLRQCARLGIARLHVHVAPDEAQIDVATVRGGVRSRDGVAITTSTWIDDADAHRALATAPLFVFAPRLAEGIGMATLEAMAHGQVVIAPDRPTANQTIGHLSSGILYDPEEPFRLPVLTEERVRRLSEAALARVRYGRRDFERDRDRLLSFLRDDGARWSSSDPSASFANQIRAAARSRLLR